MLFSSCVTPPCCISKTATEPRAGTSRCKKRIVFSSSFSHRMCSAAHVGRGMNIRIDSCAKIYCLRKLVASGTEQKAAHLVQQREVQSSAVLLACVGLGTDRRLEHGRNVLQLVLPVQRLGNLCEL